MRTLNVIPEVPWGLFKEKNKKSNEQSSTPRSKIAYLIKERNLTQKHRSSFQNKPVFANATCYVIKGWEHLQNLVAPNLLKK